jgi:hypothetical protein
MPDPKTLKVGDLVRFVGIPDEWSRPGYFVLPGCRAFMRKLLKRSSTCRVWEIDEYGQPWIQAWVRERGKLRQHTWAIFESTGWRQVKRRS